MSDKQRHPRDDIIEQFKQRAEDWDAINAAKREATMVAYLLTKLGLSKKKGALLRLASREAASPTLTFDLFDQLVVNFPLDLVYATSDHTRKLHTNPKAFLPAMCRNFRDSPFAKAYQEALEANSVKACLGLLVPRKGIIRGLVVYDAECLKSFWIPGFSQCYASGTAEHPRQLVIRPFVSVVEAITARHSGWSPETAL